MLFSACTSTTQEVQEQSAEAASPNASREIIRAPQPIQNLAGDLLRYHAQHQALPTNLSVLQDALPDYTYHPKGLGTLPDGRTILLVDTEVRLPGHAWCILRQPSQQRSTLQLDVSPIPLNELEEAARAE